MALVSTASRGDVSETAMYLHGKRFFSAGSKRFCDLPASTFLCSTITQVPELGVFIYLTQSPKWPEPLGFLLHLCGASHHPDLILLDSEHMDQESLCLLQHLSLFQTPVRFGTVRVQFEVSICATRACVFVKIKPEIGTETLDQLQGFWPVQLFLHRCSERTQGLK